MIPRGDTAPSAPQTVAGTAPSASHTTESPDPGINLVIRQMAALEAKLQAQEQRQATWQQQAAAAAREAAQSAARQHASAQADMRRWFDEKGLPKAIRIAQREAFDLLRRAGYPAASGSAPARQEAVPLEPESASQPASARVLTLAEIEEFAAQCAHNWQQWAHPIDESLAAFSTSQPFSATETAAIREQANRVLAGASVPANPFLLAR